MQLIILAAGFGTSTLENDLSLPKCLTSVGDNVLVIDKLLENAERAGITDIAVVGGDNITEVMKRYPGLGYFYADDSVNRGNLYSFLSGLTACEDDIIVAYGDIVFKNTLFEQLISNSSDIVYCYDSVWDHRYEGRSPGLLEEAEKTCLFEGKPVFCKVVQPFHQLLGEFVGVILFKKEVIKLTLNIAAEITNSNPRATILDLLNHSELKPLLSGVDIKGDWAELDSSQDLNTFQFGTKADTLDMLRGKLKNSMVLDQYSFTVREWLNDDNRIVDLLQCRFQNDKKIVVRSSALSEDTGTSSLAGNFESVLNVDIANSVAVKDAVGKVLESYELKDEKPSLSNQVFVQPFLTETDVSGVAFTRDIETKAPYYVINFDDYSKKTDTVTSGTGGDLKTYVINKFDCNVDVPWLKALLSALKEIEMVTRDDFVDVEFAIKDASVVLLQVRPIAAHKNELRVADQDFLKAITSIKSFVEAKTQAEQPGVVGAKTAYGIMPDWNPAEIIGITPKPLAMSIYKKLITDEIWPKSRAHIGYRDVGNNIGMVSIEGRPYIDLRVSFNSFTPQGLSSAISSKLIDFYISYLEENKHFHDKVEFDVALTSYSFDRLQLEKHLENAHLTQDESIEVIESLRLLTKNILENKTLSIDLIMLDLKELEAKCSKINSSNIPTEEKIHHLINDCRRFGTFQFSVLARFAFIANILLKSLVSVGVLNDRRFHEFFETISTIPNMLINDLSEMDSKTLLEKYGHLRPGTYDIESKSYKENPDILLTSQSNEKMDTANFVWTAEEIHGINQCLDEGGFELEFADFISFISKAIEAREFAKFSFTKNLSSVLDHCISLGESLSINRADMAFIGIQDILNYQGGSVSFNQHRELTDTIKYNKRRFLLAHSLKLPPLIFSEKDIDCHLYESDEPNFITNTKYVGQVLLISGNEEHFQDLTGKIILIEKADPGFDWLFAHKIGGLITLYGGVASHMAIRCAELGLPAAIGCGSLVFKFVSGSKTIELDCSSRQIHRVS